MGINKDKVNHAIDYVDAIVDILKPQGGYTLILNNCKELDGSSLTLSTKDINNG